MVADLLRLRPHRPGLGLALSMGELGATIMLYPPSWRTLPVIIFAESDRGQVLVASASTVILLAITLVGLVALGAALGRVRSGERFYAVRMSELANEPSNTVRL
jgi:hypothetical protein